MAQRATSTRPSIVHGQISTALSGQHGDVHISTRTGGSTLFVNPLMAMYLGFDLPTLAARNLYLDQLEETATLRQVALAIEEFRYELNGTRVPRAFPH